ncbi:carbohydrate kinase, thermoresistant glucokinase [Candidatus Moduliflexus flocculans]|uniref:Gluconokinase n=1 Tax=Candidatus Moduliflexus flocculans TaxID=1499966 RepID=A0A081BP74_9BACT|nr:carbohydrate kinase, thermoresistant glucokinase [Candidatus Moduliflexus flocculans]
MILIVMGVSGCGKSTIGQMLADKFNCEFYDGDDFHPAENIAKMSQGIPLNDDDRAPWLRAIQQAIHQLIVEGKDGVFACSALKERYRAILLENNPDTYFVYLKGSYETIWERMSARAGHYMKAGMLQSQFEALEEPANAITVDISGSPETMIAAILKQLSAS